MKISTNNVCAVIKGLDSMDDMVKAMAKLIKTYNNRKILYVFTTPDGEAIVIVFK